MLKNLFKDFSVYGIAPLIVKLARFFVLPFITPYLTQEDYGISGIILAYTGIIEIFYTLGLPVNLSNSFFRARFQFKWLWRQIYGFWIYWGIVYALFLAILLWFVIPSAASENRIILIVMIVLPIVFFGPTSNIAGYYFQYKKKPLEVGIRSLVFGILSLVLTLYFIKYRGLGYMGWFYTTFIVTLLSNISWWIPLNLREGITPIFNFKRATILKALKIGLPLLPHQNSGYLLNQSDRVVMDALNISTNQIGLYNVAYTAANFFLQLSNAFTKAMNPYVQELIRDKKEKRLRNLFFFSQILFFITVLLYACVSEEFFTFLIRNDSLNQVYRLSVVIVCSAMMRPMYMASNSRLFFYDQTKTISLYSFIGGVLNVILNIIFIPIFGYEIAAITTLIGFTFISFSRFWTKEYLKYKVVNYYPLLWLILTVLVCIAAYFIPTFPFIIRMVLFIFFTILLVYILIKFRLILQQNE